MATRVEVVERSEPTRCPLCLDALGPGDARAACEGCGTAHHEACRTELGGCGVLGCRFSVRSPELGAGPLRERADRYVRTMAMAAELRRARQWREREPNALDRWIARVADRVAGNSLVGRLLVSLCLSVWFVFAGFALLIALLSGLLFALGSIAGI